MVSMELVTHVDPRNSQIQSTWIARVGGVTEIWAMVVLIVADVPPVFVPGKSKLTTSSVKFEATK